MSLKYKQHYIQNPHVFGSINSNPNNQNFHQKTQNRYQSLNNNFLPIQYSAPKSFQSLNFTNSIKQFPNQSKISYARNIRQRLFQPDQLQEAKKQIVKQSYRNELEQQIKANKERKQREKEKIDHQELERQRKFYAEIGNIKAQQPKPKQEPSYIVLRSRKGDRIKQKTQKTVQSLDLSRSQSPVAQFHMPKIMKRGGYPNQQTSFNSPYPQPGTQSQTKVHNLNPEHSHSIVINKSTRQTQAQQRQMQIIRQRNYEQERITNIIKMQQNMIRKLYNFKDQILKSNNQFNMEKEVQQIRNILKSKPINLNIQSIKNDELFNNNNEFYQFPKVDHRNKARKTRNRNRSNRSRVSQGIDLNSHQQRTLTEQYQQNQNQNQAVQTSRKRQRQNKPTELSNDKNYKYVNKQDQQNPEVNIPVVLRNKRSFNHQIQDDDTLT